MTGGDDLWASCIPPSAGVAFLRPHSARWSVDGVASIVHLSRPSTRRFPRYKFESSVDISLMRGETPAMVEGFCQVLSEGGAGLRTDEPLSVHEILYVQIPFPEHPLRLPAVVRNQRGHDYGLEFLALGTPEREFIRNTCSALPRVG